jgi:hypothetical protein
MDPISVGYIDSPFQASTIEWLRSKHAAHKSCRYPNKNGGLDRNSIRVATDRYRGKLTVTIDVDIEDEYPLERHWPGPFLLLSLQLRLNLRRETCPQSQLDAYLSYNTREVALTKNYQVRIEEYTRGKLALIHTQEGWQIRHLNQLRRALEFWNVQKTEDEEIE